LEALSRSRLPVLLALLHARIAREKPFLLQNTPKFGAEFDQRAGNSMWPRSGLSVHSAAFYPDVNVEFVQSVGSLQRTLHEHAVSFVEEELLQVPIIDCESSCARP